LRADNQIKYGFPEKAEQELNGAKDVYFKFKRVIESDLPKIEMNRVAALISLE
jgi:hypothetical protein